MKTESYFLPEHRLIIEVIRGKIVLEGMLAARQHEIASGWIQPNTNTLVVIQSDAMEVRPDNLRKYTAWAAQHLAPLQGSKSAIVVSAPVPTAASLLLKEMITSIRRMQIFSSLAPAAEWLGVPVAAITKVAPETQSFDQL